MLTPILLLGAGIVFLIFGANWLVNGASTLARKYNISDLTIGLTIVAFGTSAPELVVNSLASLQNHQEIVFGNIIGSNNFNLFAILGLAGIITPLAVQSATVWKEIPFSLFAVLVLFFLANSWMSPGVGIITRVDGFILIFFFCLFLFYVYRQLKKDKANQVVASEFKSGSNAKLWFLIIIGLGSLVAGGKLVVSNAVELATVLGVSEKIIGLTIIAAGTSLPELATSIVAALKKNIDIAVGNIIGSNIFNIFLILGVSALVRPVSFDIRFNPDIYLLAGGTLLLFIAMFTGKKKKLDRWEAALLLIIFIAYTVYLISNEH